MDELLQAHVPTYNHWCVPYVIVTCGNLKSNIDLWRAIMSRGCHSSWHPRDKKLKEQTPWRSNFLNLSSSQFLCYRILCTWIWFQFEKQYRIHCHENYRRNFHTTKERRDRYKIIRQGFPFSVCNCLFLFTKISIIYITLTNLKDSFWKKALTTMRVMHRLLDSRPSRSSYLFHMQIN